MATNCNSSDQSRLTFETTSAETAETPLVVPLLAEGEQKLGTTAGVPHPSTLTAALVVGVAKTAPLPLASQCPTTCTVAKKNR